MSDITKDEAERQKREAEQAAAAASARADQAQAEVMRLRAIVEGIAALPTRANDIMAALQTARVRVETDASQASTALANLEAAQDKVAVIKGFEAVCERAAANAKADAANAKISAANAKADAEIVCGQSEQAAKSAQRERMKSWLGIILAVLALVGVVALFWFYTNPTPHMLSVSPKPVTTAVAPAQPASTTQPAPTVTPAPAPAPFLTVDKAEFDQRCLSNGLTAEQCASAWDQYTK